MSDEAHEKLKKDELMYLKFQYELLEINHRSYLRREVILSKAWRHFWIFTVVLSLVNMGLTFGGPSTFCG